MHYRLEDLYVIFRQEPTVEGKLALLEEWKTQRYPFDINWARLIRVWRTYA